MNGPNTYSAKDIERYHSGQMSVAEMHALEKAALDDPFLADALEGYALTQTPSADLASLQQRLQERIEKKEEKRSIFYIGNSWMRIAALFVLIAGGGWLVYQTLSTKPLAIATTQQAPKSAPAATPGNTKDSLSVSTDAPENETPVTAKQQPLKDQRQEQTLKESMARKQTSNPPPPMMLSRPADDSSANQGVVASQAMTLRELPVYDSASQKDAVAKRREVTSAPLPDTIKNLDVVLKRNELALEEVVVMNKKAKTAPARRMQVTIDTLEPAGGWPGFDDYIANNLHAPEELQSKPVRGEVELSFDVDKNGEPVNITVVRSLCTKCDEEAIRLLKEGPKWKKNKKKGKVTIRF
jgi:hypothetical protein